MSKYLYNGIELPALPEYDKTQYPYAFICINDYYAADELVLYVCSFKVKYKIVYNSINGKFLGYNLYSLSDGYKLRYRISSDGNEWVIDERNGGKPIYEPQNIWIEGSSDDPSFVKWANYDIYYTNDESNGDLAGTLYLAAGVDPSTTPQDFYIVKNGVAQKQDVYLRVGGQWVKQHEYLFAENTKEPIAYLYNGVRLPPLPEWDKAQYPYAVIISSNGTLYALHVDTEIKKYADMTNVTGGWYSFVTSGTGLTALINIGDNEWGEFTAATSQTMIGGTPTDSVWTNTDLYYDDVLAYAASDPVPVYE